MLLCRQGLQLLHTKFHREAAHDVLERQDDAAGIFWLTTTTSMPANPPEQIRARSRRYNAFRARLRHPHLGKRFFHTLD